MMSNANLSCSKCSGQMVRGFIPDNGHGARFIGEWFEGEPQKSFWTGLKTADSQGIPMAAFRCKVCGFIELYSKHEFGAS